MEAGKAEQNARPSAHFVGMAYWGMSYGYDGCDGFAEHVRANVLKSHSCPAAQPCAHFALFGLQEKRLQDHPTN